MDVDFNCLDTTINLQTWVVILDFLGLGAKVHDLDDYKVQGEMSRSPSKMADIALESHGKNKDYFFEAAM